MKDLHPLRIYRLQDMEFVTLNRETAADIETAATQHSLNDAPLNLILKRMKEEIAAFETAAKNPETSPETARFRELDRLRDNAFRRFGRKLLFFELSTEATEQQAFAILEPLWRRHADTPTMNRRKQTGATDNFLNDAAKQPYADAIAQIALSDEVEAIRQTNNDYRAAEEELRHQTAQLNLDKTRDLRRDLNHTHILLCNHIRTMAQLMPPESGWSELLSCLNVVRKRYAELLNRRRGSKTPEPTPPGEEPSGETTDPAGSDS